MLQAELKEADGVASAVLQRLGSLQVLPIGHATAVRYQAYVVMA